MSTLNYSAIYFSIAPRSSSSQTLNQGGNTFDVYGDDSNCPLKSVNSALTCQILWKNSTTLTQSDEGTGSGGSRQTGDLVNVIFDIFEAVNNESSPTLVDDFHLICSIKKAKDAPMKWSGRPADKSALQGHRFTINIAEVLADLLSYSLVPVGIATWGMIDIAGTGPQANGGSASSYVSQFGGMNGQWVYSNVASTAGTQNRYNLSANGCDRRIRVQARFELQAADGSLEACTSPASRGCSDFWIVNAAPQWGDRHILQDRVVSDSTPTSDGPRFLTNYPGWRNGVPLNPAMAKPIRLQDNAEYLQWFQGNLKEQSGAGNISGFGIKIDYGSDPLFSTFSTVYLVDAASNGRAKLDGAYYAKTQFRQFVQNVSPAYINQHNNGIEPTKGAWGTHIPNVISTSSPYYRCSVYSEWSTGAVITRLSAFQYYQLDTETKGNWSDVCGMDEGVKFMWLNRMGGIDSYTAKKIFTKSLEVSTETITKKSPDRLHAQNKAISGMPFNNNIGANMYPHSREVLNVDANRKYSAMTAPLPVDTANWLEELLTSPNVWIIQKNDGSKYLESQTGTALTRPSDKGYMPVIITNSDSTVIDESQGLVQLNIEFIESHKVNTQRN
jgi:hypothetical protein